VGFIFVHNRSSIYLWQRKSELDILKTQGWQGGTIAKMISLEVLMIWCMAALLSMLANVLFHEILNVEWDRLLSLWLIVTFTGGMTFAVTTHRGVSRFFKSSGGSKNKPYTKSGSEYRKTEGISAVIRKDLMYYGGRLRFMAVQLVIGGTISIFAWLARAAVAHQAVTTRLGDFIHARAGIWLMLIGAASTILVVLTCLDSILSYLDLRRRDLVSGHPSDTFSRGCGVIIGLWHGVSDGSGHIQRIFRAARAFNEFHLGFSCGDRNFHKRLDIILIQCTGFESKQKHVVKTGKNHALDCPGRTCRFGHGADRSVSFGY